MVRVTSQIRQQLVLQEGSVLVTVLGVLIIVTAFGAALTAGVSSNFGQSVRDRSTKRALAAAEAGVQEATYRLNMTQPTSAQPCVTLSSGTIVLTSTTDSNGWCNTETVTLGSDASASYRVSPYTYNAGVVTRTIVSTGTVGGITRRVQVTSSANTGAPLFEPYALASDLNLTLSGNANVTGSARSNNDINMSGNARICGTNSAAIPGPGHSVHLSGNANVCSAVIPASAPFALNPVDQGDAKTNNDNGRFFAQDPKTGTVTWNASTRQLSLSGNSTLTLGGHTYSLCSLSLSGNSQLIIAAAAVVRLYIDSPASCGLANNATQFSVSGNGKIINTSQLPDHLQIYMAGSGPSATNGASFTGNSVTSQLSFYAPYTNLNISGNGSTYSGALVAKQITISGNGASVAYNSRVESITQTTVGVYRRQKFVECTPSNTSTTPDTGC